MGQILTGDALNVLRTLPSNSVQCMVTSPPYYGLRDYGVAGQLGLEPTPALYISRLVEVFTEAHRVLKPDGTLWVNIADSYAGSRKGCATYPSGNWYYKQQSNKGMISQIVTTTVGWGNCKPKDLIGIPFMLALALRDNGWYFRQDIIWDKPNCMPESVKDRCTRSHEYLFLFSKSRKYYFDSEAIKEPCIGFNKTSPRGSIASPSPNSGRRKGNNKTFRGGGAYTNNRSFDNSGDSSKASVGNTPNETGLRNKRSVWRVSTLGIKEAHFATFPPELIRPCILAGCPVGGMVLDMFGGSGTTGVVAAEENRDFILIDINDRYNELAERRIAL